MVIALASAISTTGNADEPSLYNAPLPRYYLGQTTSIQLVEPHVVPNANVSRSASTIVIAIPAPILAASPPGEELSQATTSTKADEVYDGLPVNGQRGTGPRARPTSPQPMVELDALPVEWKREGHEGKKRSRDSKGEDAEGDDAEGDDDEGDDDEGDDEEGDDEEGDDDEGDDDEGDDDEGDDEEGDDEEGDDDEGDDDEGDDDEGDDDEGDDEEGDDEGSLQSHIEALDQLLSSELLQNIMQLKEENIELRAQLKIQEIEAKAKLRMQAFELEQPHPTTRWTTTRWTTTRWTTTRWTTTRWI